MLEKGDGEGEGEVGRGRRRGVEIIWEEEQEERHKCVV